ncbi:MAG: hypothetical protein IID51_08395 [Proteobacteria bacterium]|nr:hypothetical protein [Pseudomonadota bacterium]
MTYTGRIFALVAVFALAFSVFGLSSAVSLAGEEDSAKHKMHEKHGEMSADMKEKHENMSDEMKKKMKKRHNEMSDEMKKKMKEHHKKMHEEMEEEMNEDSGENDS